MSATWIQWPTCLGQQDTTQQNSRARRAKRDGDPIRPRRAFLAYLALHAARSLNRLCSFVVIIIGREAKGFRLALGDFLIHFIEPATRATKNLPD